MLLPSNLLRLLPLHLKTTAPILPLAFSCMTSFQIQKAKCSIMPKILKIAGDSITLPSSISAKKYRLNTCYLSSVYSLFITSLSDAYYPLATYSPVKNTGLPIIFSILQIASSFQSTFSLHLFKRLSSLPGNPNFLISKKNLSILLQIDSLIFWMQKFANVPLQNANSWLGQKGSRIDRHLNNYGCFNTLFLLCS